MAVHSTVICGSDLHFFDGDLPSIDELSIGHEAVGQVVAVGDAVERVKVGDRGVVPASPNAAPATDVRWG